MLREVLNINNNSDNKPFIIAEMSGNHNQSLDRALEIVEEAAKTGVDALKIQTYTPDTMTLDVDRPEFIIKDKGNLWEGRTLHNLYEEAHTPWEWHEPIFEKCKELGIIGFSSPFDETAVDFLEKLEVPLYKVASFEIVHLPLIKRIAKTGKPMIISTGMATIAEINDAVQTAKENGCKNIVLLKCTSTYPASPSDSDIATIPHIRDLFNCEVGLSDHTLGLGVAVASVVLGGTVIEKHFTLDREDGGVDSTFSLEPKEMTALVREVNRAYKSIGTINYTPSDKEMNSRKRRRSIYVSKNIKKGELFTEENVKVIRPGNGIKPKYMEEILGKQSKIDLVKGTPLSWENIY